MPDFSVSSIDIAVLIVYVIGTRLLFGWYLAGRIEESAENYFLAGRKLTWPIIGLSFYVSNMSGSSFVGLPGTGYAHGVSVYNYEWVPVFVLIFFVFFILPEFLRHQIYTAPEYLERRFHRSARLVFSVFLLLANIFIDAAAALYAGGTVVQTLYPDISLWLTVGVISSIAGLYIFFGGLGAVVINDVLQAIVIMFGGILISVLAYMKIPSWSALREATPPEHLKLFQPLDDPFMPWPGIFTGVLIIGFYFWCTNQFIIQRTLGAKSLEHGQWGALFAGLLKLPNLFILILPGVFAAYLYPDLENPDMAFPALAFDLLPVGLRGLILAAIAAAILSSLEAILNSASTLLTMDIIKTSWPEMTDKALVRIGRIATLVFMVIAAVWAPQIAQFPSLWDYLQSILAYVTPPVVVVFLMGLFWKKANSRGAITCLAGGIQLGAVGWIANEVYSVTQIPFLYACGIFFLFNILLFIVGNLTGRPAREISVIDSELFEVTSSNISNIAWYYRPSVLAIALSALTLGILIVWR